MESVDTIGLPGLGLPLDHMPVWRRRGEKNRFPHAIADYFTTEGVTLREQRMLDFINQITDKQRWWEKVHDEDIVEKWRVEACGSEADQETSPVHLSQNCFNWCMRELKDKAAYLEQHGVVHALDVEATIVKADLEDDDALCLAISEAVKPLEHVPESRKDWHPGSDGLVLDLVHPSLFPLQYGKTIVLPTGGVNLSNCTKNICRGEQCPIPQELSEQSIYPRVSSWSNNSKLRPWGNYQWLPSDIRFQEDGAGKIQSYVNNLHPRKHSHLYSVLEKAISRAMPLWNECLSWFHTRLRIRVGDVSLEDFKIPSHLRRGEVGSEGTDEAESTNGGVNVTAGEEEGIRGIEEDDDDDDDEDEDESEMDAIRGWLKDNPDQRQLIQPDIDKAFIGFDELAEQEGQRRIDLRRDFPSGIQVIIKLANIHLTPDQPHYHGSDWHVEGALNEHICATALVYYDQENISDSYLEFRHQVDAEAMVMLPPQDEWEAAVDMFGIEHEGPAIQDLGKVLTRKGRMLAFPNVMQHRIRPFELADPTRSGYRKILAMFLVDPHIRIPSTANVPPQQRDWWAEEVRLIEPFAGLPVELFHRIIEEVEEFPISWEEACEVREALMAERGRAKEEFDRVFKGETFFFCEH